MVEIGRCVISMEDVYDGMLEFYKIYWWILWFIIDILWVFNKK